MSDFADGEEYQYEWPDDDQNEWGNNSDGNGEDDPSIQVENQYYEAEDNMKENPKQAIE
jgi:COP9 signalosome complex subunit 2